VFKPGDLGSEIEREQAMSKQEMVERNPAAGFGTVEEARAAKPDKHPKWKVWKVVNAAGQERYLWADGLNHALKQVALADGYAARCLDRKPMNPGLVAGVLAALTAEERATILAPYLAKKSGK
jgi:hypothetical protein